MPRDVKKVQSIAFINHKDMSVEEETNALGGVTEDISIAERVEVVIQKYVTLSIIGGYYSTAA